MSVTNITIKFANNFEFSGTVDELLKLVRTSQLNQVSEVTILSDSARTRSDLYRSLSAFTECRTRLNMQNNEYCIIFSPPFGHNYIGQSEFATMVNQIAYARS